MDNNTLTPKKESTFLESMTDRLISINNSIEDANDKLVKLLDKLRGELPKNMDPEKHEPSSGGLVSKIDVSLSENTSRLNELHNQIDELNKYI